MTDQELEKIRDYLNKIFNTDDFIVKKRKTIEDSCEVYHNEEFLGLIYKENEDSTEETDPIDMVSWTKECRRRRKY